MGNKNNLSTKLKNNRLVKRYTDPSVYKEEAKDVITALKKEPSNIKEAFSTIKSDSVLRKRQFVETKRYIDLLKVFIPVVLLLVTASAFLCLLEKGAFDLYMSVVLPFFLIISFLFFFCIFYHCSIMYTTFTSVLILFGVCFQVLLESKKEDVTYDNVEGLFIYALLGIFLGLIMMLVLNYAYHYADKRFILFAVLGVSVLIYLILLFFGNSFSGTKAWLYIGSQSIQLTEITKVLALIGLAVAFTDKNRSYKLRLLNALIIVGINAVFLAAISELGTLVVISMGFFALGLVFLPKRKEFVIILVMCLIILSSGLGVGAVCSRIVHTYDAAVASENEEGNETESESGSEDEEDTSAAETEASEEEDSDTETTAQDEEAAEKKIIKVPDGIAGKIMRKVATLYDKVYKRFAIVFKPEIYENDPEDPLYQSKQARKALWATGWLSSDPEFEPYVPVIESDLIFIYALMKIGIIGAIFIIFILMILLSETAIYASKNKNLTEAATSIGFISVIVVQSITSAASAVGLVPTVGVTFAFLSSGGTATMVNYAMTLFILYSMRNDISFERKKNIITRGGDIE